MSATPLPPDETARALTEVLDVLGPLYRRSARVVEAAEPIEGVSIGVRAVLDHVQQTGTQTVPAIASALALSRQFVQRCVHEAADRGWAEIHANPAHRRSSLIALTPGGASVMAAVAAREHAVLGAVQGITAEDAAACLRVLRRMHAMVTAQEPPDGA